MKINIIRILLNTVLFLLISTAAWAATSPVIFYSDLTSGPNTGGQNNNGVFVTIWGNNFGTIQGSSSITIGGGKVASYQTWTNTEICFQLGSSAVTGNIVVTTSNGISNGIPFTVRSGNIYFVNPSAASNGSGTYASPFNHLWYAYNIQAAGDTVYVEAGVISDEEDAHAGWHSIITTQNAGTQADPIAYVAYPNATVVLKADGGTATWTDGSSGGNDQVQYIFRDDGGSWTTISKFTMELTGTGAITEVDAGTDTGWRVVGNTLTANAYIYAQIDFAGPNAEVIGNTIYNSGAGMSPSNENHSIYLDGASNPFEIGWNYLYGNENSGWEISCFHQGQRNGSIHDNLIIAGSAGSVKGILLGDVDTGETQSTEWGSTYNVYNNILVNTGQADNGGAMQLVDGTGYIYNNTIYYSGTETKGIVQVPTIGVGPNGGNAVWYFADNIIVANNAGLYISDENGNAPNWSFFALLTNNNYYGQGNGPTNDAKAINANPQFITPGTAPGTNFQLQAASPDINAGYNTTAIAPEDFSGLVRSTTPTIGAYQYSSGTSILPSLPVVTITSPSTGISITAGTNVTITTTASESNGTISNISLYNTAGVLLGSSSSSPYNYVMTNAVAGTYTFTAIAKDVNGVSTTSIPVIIIVTAQGITPSPAVVTIINPISGSSYVAGSNVPVTVSASETNGTIRYMYLYNGLGILLGSSPASSSTGSFTYIDTNMAPGGYSFFAVATDANGVASQSSTTIITLTSTAVAPSITTQPASMTVTAPATATFSVSAAGTPTPSYQWQQEAPGSGTYTTISGATSSFYTTAATTISNNGTKFKCVISNTAGSVTSSVATLTVNTVSAAPSITTQPASVSVIAPATATFSVAASGTPAPTYQWMQSVNGGAYGNISGATNASYTTAATTTANSGTQFKCVVTNASGSATSNAATLTVKGLPVVAITSPSSGSSVTAGSDVSITVSASETNGTIANVAFYNGSTLLGSDSTSPYTYVMTNPAAGSYTLTAVATDANGVSTTSSAITITVAAQPAPSAAVVTITNPTNGSTYTAGSNLPITVSASETNGSIRYIYLYTGSGVFLGSSYAGSSTGSFTYNETNLTAGAYSFYAVATDANGVVSESSTTTIMVIAPSPPVVAITSPSNKSSLKAGSNVTITVNASETNGTIVTVFLYSGTTLLGSDSTPPYAFTITNVPAGTYTLTAMATDLTDNSTTSSPVTVKVS